MNAFIWMFKEKDFKKHFVLLAQWILIGSILLLATAALFSIFSLDDLFSKTSFLVIMGVLISLPCLLPLGYFWELTENIIDRTYDIQSNSVYNGKIKKIYKIKLPIFDVPKFVWRGFASLVACAILFGLYGYLIYLYCKNASSYQYPEQMYIFFWILMATLLPALLWNYAKQNSILAVLNFPKAVYLIGNYFSRYIVVLIALFVIFVVNVFLDKFLVEFIQKFIQSGIGVENLILLPIFLIYLVLSILKDIYLIYVLSYILANIVPETEN